MRKNIQERQMDLLTKMNERDRVLRRYERRMRNLTKQRIKEIDSNSNYRKSNEMS